MKTNTKKLSSIIKRCLDIAWVLNFILFAIALIALTAVFASKNYAEMDMIVRIPPQNFEHKIKTYSGEIQQVWLTTREARLGFKLKNTPFGVISSFLLLFAIEAIAFTIIWQLRKIFSNLEKGYSFTIENVTSLKMVALCVLSIIPVKAIIYLMQLQVLKANFSDFVKYPIKHVSFIELSIISLVIYIVAAIIDEGLQLKQENEEFI